MEKYPTGSVDAIIQRMGEFLVPKYFGAVELDSSSDPNYAVLYSDAEKTKLVLKVPIGAAAGTLYVTGVYGSVVTNRSGSFGILSEAFFHVTDKAVIIAAYKPSFDNQLLLTSGSMWLFAKDEQNTTVAIRYNTSNGLSVFRPGNQINSTYRASFISSAELQNAFCTILVPAFSVDANYAENINGVYLLATTSNLVRASVGVLSLNGKFYDILACWAIER